LSEQFFESVYFLLTKTWYQWNHLDICFFLELPLFSVGVIFCFVRCLPWGKSLLRYFLVAAALFMLFVGYNHAWRSCVTVNGAFKITNYTHENTGAGHNFLSKNAKCESIPKPPYLSGIVTYKNDQTAIFHINFAYIHFPVSFFLFSSSPPTVMMTPW